MAKTIDEKPRKSMGERVSELNGRMQGSQAWNSIFQYFNRTHGRGRGGYKAGGRSGGRSFGERNEGDRPRRDFGDRPRRLPTQHFRTRHSALSRSPATRGTSSGPFPGSGRQFALNLCIHSR